MASNARHVPLDHEGTVSELADALNVGSRLWPAIAYTQKSKEALDFLIQ